MIYGKSGTGKTRSLLNFDEDEILYVNVIRKRVPFPKKFKYEVKTDNVGTIRKQLENMPLKIAVIDDAGYLLTNKFMAGHRGSNQFDLYNDIADDFFSLMQFIKRSLPDDVIVYVIMHEVMSDNTSEVKLRTIGKLLDDKCCIEGMATIVLRSIKSDDGYYFSTNSLGTDISKSPEGMFERKIENDLKAVDKRIREYWGMAPSK